MFSTQLGDLCFAGCTMRVGLFEKTQTQSQRWNGKHDNQLRCNEDLDFTFPVMDDILLKHNTLVDCTEDDVARVREYTTIGQHLVCIVVTTHTMSLVICFQADGMHAGRLVIPWPESLGPLPSEPEIAYRWLRHGLSCCDDTREGSFLKTLFSEYIDDEDFEWKEALTNVAETRGGVWVTPSDPKFAKQTIPDSIIAVWTFAF